MTAYVRRSAWYGERNLPPDFPDGWDGCRRGPADAPDIGARGASAAFVNPTGTALPESATTRLIAAA